MTLKPARFFKIGSHSCAKPCCASIAYNDLIMKDNKLDYKCQMWSSRPTLMSQVGKLGLSSVNQGGCADGIPYITRCVWPCSQAAKVSPFLFLIPPSPVCSWVYEHFPPFATRGKGFNVHFFNKNIIYNNHIPNISTYGKRLILFWCVRLLNSSPFASRGRV